MKKTTNFAELCQGRRSSTGLLLLLDVPQHRDRRVGDAGEGIAVSAAGGVLPGRQIEGGLEGATLDLVGQLAALRFVGSGEPGHAQPLDCLVTRPAGEGPVTARGTQIAVG